MGKRVALCSQSVADLGEEADVFTGRVVAGEGSQAPFRDGGVFQSCASADQGSDKIGAFCKGLRWHHARQCGQIELIK